MTPMFFRSKSPMLRVIANLPLTFGCPRLFQVIKPPLFFILEGERQTEDYYNGVSCSSRQQPSRGNWQLWSLYKWYGLFWSPADVLCGTTNNIFVPLFLVFPLGSVVDSEFKGLALAAQHGSAVTHTAHYKLNAVPQQGHSGGGSCIHPWYYRDINGNMRGGKCHQKGPNTKSLFTVFTTGTWCVWHSHIHTFKHGHMGGKSKSGLAANERLHS